MRHIQRLVLKNYRSLADIDLEMRPLNVLIGRNGSGKSNFLSFFDLLRNGRNERLNDAIRNMGGFVEILYYKQFYDPISWTIIFTEPDSKDLSYHVELVSSGSNISYRVKFEKLSAYSDSAQVLASEELVFVSIDSIIQVLASTRNENDAEPLSGQQSGDLRELAITRIRDRGNYPILAEIQELLEDWIVFRGFGNEALTKIRGSELLNPSFPLRLSPSGDNLISVIQQLANNPEHETIYERLNDVMHAVFDDFKRLDIQLMAAGRGALSYRSSYFPNKSIPALSMSDGQLRFLGLAVLLLLPNPPPLIAIHEPEIGMHPRMLAVFAELLKEASERTQIIVSTHSPQLINHLSPENIIVVDQDTENGATTLRHLETDKLNVWLERYSLGQLWTMGRLDKVATA